MSARARCIRPPIRRNPQWADLSSTVGAQYMWVDRLFVYSADPDNFMFQLVHTYRPGAMDTSLVSTDNINNPRTMNAVYSLGPRLAAGAALGPGDARPAASSTTSSSTISLSSGPLTEFFQKPDTVWTPRVLKDGSDSVGALGALNRVYLNIGLFSEEWLLHFSPVVGGKPIIADSDRDGREELQLLAGDRGAARRTWRCSSSRPRSRDRLKDAPGGAKYLTATRADAGSRQDGVCRDLRALPFQQGTEAAPVGLDPPAALVPTTCSAGTGTGPGRRPTNTSGRCATIVQRAGFPRRQLPVHRSARAGDAAANQRLQPARDQRAGRQHLGQLLVAVVQDAALGRHDHGARPVHRQAVAVRMPAGGRGYTRPPSLISLWSTAPFLLNNTVGEDAFEQDPSVDAPHARVPGVDRADAVAGETREGSAVLGDKGDPVCTIDRTTARSSSASRRATCRTRCDPLSPLAAPPDAEAVRRRWRHHDRPDPQGMPVNLLANLQPLPESSNPIEIAATHRAAGRSCWSI